MVGGRDRRGGREGVKRCSGDGWGGWVNSDVEKAWKKYPQHPVIEGVRFPPFGSHMKEIWSNSL